jgi:hypothetical protein
MFADVHLTHRHKWRRLEISSENGRIMRFTPYRGLAILLLIPILLLALYFTFPSLTGDSVAEVASQLLTAKTDTALQLNPACSPFGALTPCVTMAAPSSATMGIWQPAV